MDYTGILQSIIENFGGGGVFVVSVLIICIVAIPVGLPILLNKLFTKNSKNITDNLTNSLQTISSQLTSSMSNQNKELVSTLAENQNKLLDTQTTMISYIMANITNLNHKHTTEHTYGMDLRMNHVDTEINKILHDMLLTFNADRTVVLEFHNSNVNLTGMPFMWYDSHYEQIAKDVDYLTNKIQNIPTSNIAPIIEDLKNGTDEFIIYDKEKIESIKNKSTVLYYQLLECNIKYLIYGPLYDSENKLIGLCAIEYSKYNLGDDVFNKFINDNSSELHSQIAKIALLLDFKNRNIK